MSIGKIAQSLGVELSSSSREQIMEKERWLKLADAPFPYHDYKVNYDGNIYIAQQCIADRNALLFDQFQYEAEEAQVNTDTWCVGVWVKVRAIINGKEHSVRQYGVHTISKLRGDVKPVGDAMEQAIKSAVSDGMKKCSSWLGIAAHIYRGEVISIRANRNKEGQSQSKFYLQNLEKFGLSEYEYKYGIPVLPDSFKSFYEKMDWTDGIFYSDVFGYRDHQEDEHIPSEKMEKVQERSEAESPAFINDMQANYLRGLIYDFNENAQEADIVQAIIAYLVKRKVDVVQEAEEMGRRFTTVDALPSVHFTSVHRYFKQLRRARLESTEEKSA
ncbi:Rad52/Rad22 family DNA repair protein [Aneurinibacillus aneurinilyticus]|uniref:Rad52/Rad22 family DNA repair protein n=1 Tax=Aneurinibacillus aneurinilyticus TaxID=1391 RepID=UPI002E1A7546|nr:hypothetical protein [Aneurinibacillus aneurinilyticus]